MALEVIGISGREVLLSVRDPVSRHESTGKTIFSKAIAERAVAAAPDRERAISVFNQHIENVKREIPADRLLVYGVGDGWALLCSFLGVPAPETPYPRTNSSEEFAGIFSPMVK